MNAAREPMPIDPAVLQALTPQMPCLEDFVNIRASEISALASTIVRLSRLCDGETENIAERRRALQQLKFIAQRKCLELERALESCDFGAFQTQPHPQALRKDLA
jgi:hypothetical protein